MVRAVRAKTNKSRGKPGNKMGETEPETAEEEGAGGITCAMYCVGFVAIG